MTVSIPKKRLAEAIRLHEFGDSIDSIAKELNLDYETLRVKIEEKTKSTTTRARKCSVCGCAIASSRKSGQCVSCGGAPPP